MSRFKPDNLLHLIHDDILPLQATIREQIGTNKIDILFFNDHWPLLIGHPFFKQLAKRVFSQNEFTSESVICFQNAYLGLSTSTVWYQYGFKRPQSPIPRKPEEYRYMQIQVNELREKLFSLMRLDRIDCPRRNIVLIAREENRRILNLNEFSRYISKKFSNNLDVILVSRDKIDNFIELKQLINRVMCAEKFVAMHGSEQILALFIKPPANNQIEVIELFPYGIEAERSTIYRTFAESILGYRYSAWTNPIRANTRFPNENVHGLSHLTEEQKNSIQKSIDEPLEPFLCCDHLGWLYRIYQDTIVDINIFNRFLDEMKMTTDQHHHSSSLSLLNHNHQFWNFGEVQNLRCQFISIKNDEDIDRIKIEWDPPWNLPFIIEQQQKHESQRQYHYEVIIQKENDTDLKQPVQHNVYHTSNTWFELNYNENSFHCFHVWIKIKLNRNKSENGIIKSHFNRRPLFCCQNDDGST
ncbi:protein O-linked-mannose beta-1,4-N-acetylglucosaminyltransferase 2-like [Dermatophagoides pteronyssinus]|uniref:protein O-linked-mannose beta-1,4-N-acetylglucosaminyltransferase 2-like n=1 Tax=Dermatophagoides pteronyssinus TaxID=6956 RepID=UPI003F66B87D